MLADHVGDLATLSCYADAEGVKFKKKKLESNLLYSLLIAFCVVSRGLVLVGMF